MKSFGQRPADSPVIDNRQAALETLDEFFRIYHLVEAQEELRVMLQAALKMPEFSSEVKREETIYFCEKLGELIAVAHQLKS